MMESSVDFKMDVKEEFEVEVKEEPVDSQVLPGHVPFPSGVDRVRYKCGVCDMVFNIFDELVDHQNVDHSIEAVLESTPEFKTMSEVGASKSDSEDSGSPVSSGSEMCMSDDGSPVRKKKCTSDMSSGRGRTSARHREGSRKQWVVFDFTKDRPGSLMTVPSSWIIEESNNKKLKITWCLWPEAGSIDEKNIKKLIKNCSEPDTSSWDYLPGRIKGRDFKTWNKAEAYLKEKLGISISSSCNESDSCSNRNDTELNQLAHQGALKVQQNVVAKELASNNDKKLNIKTLNKLPRVLNSKRKTESNTTSTSKTILSSKELVNTIPGPRNEDSNRGKTIDTTPSTSKTILNSKELVNTIPGPKNADSNGGKTIDTTPSTSKTILNSKKLVNTIPGPRNADSNTGKTMDTTLSTSRALVSQTSTSSSSTAGDATLQSNIAESLPSGWETQHMTEKDVSACVINLLKIILKEVRELKSKVDSSECTQSIVENPFDELTSFGFKATSVKERTRT